MWPSAAKDALLAAIRLDWNSLYHDMEATGLPICGWEVVYDRIGSGYTLGRELRRTEHHYAYELLKRGVLYAVIILAPRHLRWFDPVD